MYTIVHGVFHKITIQPIKSPDNFAKLFNNCFFKNSIRNSIGNIVDVIERDIIGLSKTHRSTIE